MAALLAVVPAALWVVNAAPAQALANGLARIPPMGWNDWGAYRLNDTEGLVKHTADTMVSSGMAAAGYT